MKALVYNCPGEKPPEDRPEPTLQLPTDAVAEITTSSPGALTSGRLFHAAARNCRNANAQTMREASGPLASL